MALLGNLKGSAQLFQSTEFYNGVAKQSLRFEMGDSAYLYRTPSSAGNRRTFTFSAWIKRGNFDENNVGGGSDTTIFSAGTSSVFDTLRFVSQSFTSIKNILQLYTFDGSNDYSEEVNRGFRDSGSWYHIVFAVDTTQSTAGNRVKYYVNGTLQTSVGQYYAQVPQNYQTSYNHTEPQWIGRNINSTGRYFDGYMAEVNFVDGTQYDASYFGETKNGVWIAKEPNVTYGTNGFRLQFKEVGGSANSSGIGADTSGNGNHFSISGFTGYDSVWKDSPENNFSVMTDLSFPSTTDNIAEGGLRVGKTDQMVHASTFAFPTSGKWYWEIYSKSSDGSNYYMPYAGVCNTTFFHGEQDVGGNAGDGLFQKSGFSYIRGNDAKYKNLTGTSVVDGTNTATEGQAGTEQGIVGFALDVDAGTIKYYWNNSLVRTDSTLTAGDEYFAFTLATNSGSNIWNYNYFNFGQDSTFANQITQGGNSDGNGIGDFKYSPPSGHLALCATNLPEPIIGPNSATQADDHFNTVTFSGTGSSPLSVTGVGFQPDWIWMKRRDAATNGHNIHYDSTRGGTNALRSSAKSAQSQFGDMVVTFASDGFSFTGTDGLNASSSYSNVAWNWKANGGTTSSNTDGSLTSTVQANTTAGFSIVTWTESTANSQTIGHGLGATPAMIISKLTDDSNLDWYTFHQTLTKSNRISFNSTSTRTSSSFWNGTLDSDVFHVGYGDSYDNKSAVAYCFAEVEGYSKFRGYTGNDATDGTFVYTGFSPAFVVLRYVSGSAGGTKNWLVYDNKRSPLNPNDEVIYANQYDAESADSSFDIDLLSNGFKLRNAEGPVNNAAEYLYMAFAEQPFKYANAR